MVTTTDAKNKEFVWVKRGDMWVKKYPASWKGYREPVTRGYICRHYGVF